MSHAQLIEFVDRSSPEDRLFLQAYLEHVARASDPEYGRDLDRRLEAMRAGDEVSPAISSSILRIGEITA